MTPLTRVSFLVLHGSYTPKNMHLTIERIRKWHTDDPPRGNGWSEVGYHYFLTRTGFLELGRPETAQGAHVKGYNDCSLGICLSGGMSSERGWVNNYSRTQFERLKRLLDQLLYRYPRALVVGHNYFADRGCPGFDWRAWCDKNAFPTPEE